MNKKNKQFLGWIALDIDGTITLEKLSVPDAVIDYLRQRIKDGWRIAIATGRPLTFALLGLRNFDFPFLLLAQNGTIAIEMPAHKCLFKRYFLKKRLCEIELSCEGFAGDFAVYGGYDAGDCLYYRPGRLDRENLFYIQAMAKNQHIEARPVDSFDNIEEKIPLVKCWGFQREMKKIAARLETKQFNAPCIIDPYMNDYYMLLVSDLAASKGLSLTYAMDLLDARGPVIAAGDDENDASLLQAADVKIAMAHAPASLQSLAQIIAPPTKEFGIITALEMALKGLHG